MLQIATNGRISAAPLATSSGGTWQTQAGIFQELFTVFLILGAIVGIVVISYVLYNAYKYRDTGEDTADVERPTMGELPTGEGGGKKLFLSFGLSALIVISLIVYGYGLLLAAEQPQISDASEGVDGEMQIQVDGFRFGWRFTYESGYETDNGTAIPEGESSIGELRVPENYMIRLDVTSIDVWHAFGITELRVKADAIPGQTAHTWFVAPDTGDQRKESYLIECFENCGAGHSNMEAQLVVMDQKAFDEWVQKEYGNEDGGNE